MRRSLLAFLGVLALGNLTSAATLMIAPDRQTYQVGETITLNVFGDSEGAAVNDFVFGRILFDPDLADYVDSHQEPLTTNGFPWALGGLAGGSGFGDAFSQVRGEADPVDGPLTATVRLLATAPGTLEFSWEADPFSTTTLVFFGLTSAPGGSVDIVPEPSTGVLVAFGVVATTIGRRVGQHRRR